MPSSQARPSSFMFVFLFDDVGVRTRPTQKTRTCLEHHENAMKKFKVALTGIHKKNKLRSRPGHQWLLQLRVRVSIRRRRSVPAQDQHKKYACWAYHVKTCQTSKKIQHVERIKLKAALTRIHKNANRKSTAYSTSRACFSSTLTRMHKKANRHSAAYSTPMMVLGIAMRPTQKHSCLGIIQN